MDPTAARAVELDGAPWASGAPAAGRHKRPGPVLTSATAPVLSPAATALTQRGAPVRIKVLMFAAARERAGVAEHWIEVPDGAPQVLTLGGLQAAVLAAFPALAPLLPYLRWAVDEAFADDPAQPLAPGQVVALIPPVSGGDGRAALSQTPLDVAAVEALVAAPDCGGRVTFVGTVRDHTGAHGVEGLEYEAYAPMALRVFTALLDAAAARWPGTRAAVHHRLGALAVGEVAVVVAVAAPHRAEAFEACRFLIEGLKADAPIFKRERRTDGAVWVGLGP